MRRSKATADEMTHVGASFAFEVRDAEPFRVIEPDGKLRVGAKQTMSDDEALRALEWMVLSRRLDMWGTRLQRMGRIGLYTPVEGQEASVVGAALTLDPLSDWLVPAYREQPAWLMHGLPIERLIGQYMGKRSAVRIPDDVNMLPRQQSVATQLPHAVGLAWSLKIQKKRAGVLVFCGDGATSEGDFHEACNLAGVVAAPLVIFVQNNSWAISTPTSKQTAASCIAARAPGYGFSGFLVDGNDVFAVFEVARRAVARAREGAGPTLIESRTYRLGFHNTSDNPNEYRTSDELETAMALDPIRRLELYLASRGKWDETTGASLQERADERIKSAIDEADKLPANTASDVFDHVFADTSQRLLNQRARALSSEAS